MDPTSIIASANISTGDLRRLRLRTKRVVTNLLAGSYRSAFKGQGIEFDEVREYVAGDDVRAIDWNVTARMNTPFVKVMKEERQLRVVIVLDTSSSLDQPDSAGPSKAGAARQFAALVTLLAIYQNDEVGLIRVGSEVEQIIPPKKGRSQERQIFAALSLSGTGGVQTNLKAGLEAVPKLGRSGSLVFVLSDFMDEGYQGVMTQVAAHHDLTCIHVVAPEEESPPGDGLMLWQDSETGELCEVDCSSKVWRQAFLKKILANQQRLENKLRSTGSNYVVFRAGQSAPSIFLRYMTQRAGRR